ncbi:MAG: terminase family protein [Porticoccaceae bacterium]|nr:terminase family protein [Porticoccaceae bacterium]
MSIKSPIELLLPYQRRIYDDRARFVAWLASRQVGKSFGGAARCVRDAMTTAKTDVLVVSPSERQSYEAVLKCRDWSEAFDFAIAEQLDERDAPGALMKSATIVYPNGSRIIAVPGKPDTVRGFSAHVWMDEFAFFEDPDATWKAIFPSISNPLRGQKRLFISSTANGKGGRGARFYRICSGQSRGWSVHTTTILDAAPHLGTDVEELREAIDSDEAWAQEYMCEFIDSSNVLLPYDIIALAESAEATTYADPAIFAPESRAQLYLGIDFGRIHDPTVCWTLEKVGDVSYTREVLVLRGMSTPDQEAALNHRIAAARRVVLDYTGPGIGLGDYLVKTHGEYAPQQHKFGKVELATFTVNFKREIFPRLRRAFEAPTRLRVPIDVEVREDLHEMQQIVRNGQYNYMARRTAEGHSDRCTALALAWRAAAAAQAPTFMPRPFRPRTAYHQQEVM